MKMKYIWLCAVLIAALCLGLSACTVNGISEQEITQAPEPTHGTSVPNITLQNYDEYLKFVQSSQLPDNFVYYEDISTLGSFESMVVLTQYDFSECMYSIKDEHIKFAVYIYLKEDESVELPIINTVNVNDMRVVNTMETCQFNNGNMEYTYVQGQLASICWREGNVEYVVSSNKFKDYPLDADTAISKLLKAETAEAVAAAIVEKVEKS